MTRIDVAIQGTAPLLMNRFSDDAAQKASSARSSSFNSNEKGLPREQAQRKLYVDEAGVLHLPGPNIFRAIIDSGYFHKSGKRQLTTNKTSLVPAALTLVELACPIVVPGRSDVPWEVDSRSVVIPATGGRIMAHRPRIDRWQVSFTLEVDTSIFSLALTRDLVDDAGKRIGLGDFRPARKGPFGRFVVVKWQAEEIKKLAA